MFAFPLASTPPRRQDLVGSRVLGWCALAVAVAAAAAGVDHNCGIRADCSISCRGALKTSPDFSVSRALNHPGFSGDSFR